jgi:hypothetical protein
VGDRISALVALDRDVDWRQVEHTLAHADGVEVIGVLDGLEEVWDAIEESRADLLLVGYSPQRESSPANPGAHRARSRHQHGCREAVAWPSF